MKILMLGWEYPPAISGGLGIAIQGIAEGLAHKGHEVSFLLPKKLKHHKSNSIQLIDASSQSIDPDYWMEFNEETSLLNETQLGSEIMAYMPSTIITKLSSRKEKKLSSEKRKEAEIELTGKYNNNLLSETGKYALLAVQLARKNDYDLVYCHDWPTFKAGKLIHTILGVDYVVHFHSTEYDRNGVFTHPIIIEQEKNGLTAAKNIFAVSEKTKQSILDHYEVKAKKVSVIPNATSTLSSKSTKGTQGKKTIAFIGRLTDQKSPGTFIDLARELISRGKDYDFLVVGEGYLMDTLIEKAKQLNLTGYIKFPGFITHDQVQELLSEVDLLICPSVSEPFGLIMLEALRKNVIVLASPGSGLSEFIPSIPQVDRWDIHNMATQAAMLVDDSEYKKTLLTQCQKEAKKLSWSRSVESIEKVLL